jgi:hypothetical protein
MAAIRGTSLWVKSRNAGEPRTDPQRLYSEGWVPCRSLQMPWTQNDAERHTRKATTPALKELWAKVANESLERTGDEGRAIREANAVVGRQAQSS